MTIADTTSELADLIPALAAALERDTAETVSGTHAWLPGNLVNEDVHAAMLALDGEVPAVTRAGFDGLGERWQSRDVDTCLTALPRLGDRLHDLNRISEEAALTWQAAGWLRMTKRALLMREPDLQVGPCPYALELAAEHARQRMLMRAGREAFLRSGRDGPYIEWVEQWLIYCAAEGCGAQWRRAEWAFLGRLLERVYGVAGGNAYRGLARAG